MRIRTLSLGTRNIIGTKVTDLRQSCGMKQKDLLARLQIEGMEVNASGLSKIEGQQRSVTDRELVMIANVFDVSLDWLLGRDNYIKGK